MFRHSQADKKALKLFVNKLVVATNLTLEKTSQHSADIESGLVKKRHIYVAENTTTNVQYLDSRNQ
jgi:hypothetical protein